MSSILLATDGSEYASHAASRAIELADERDATLYVLCVVDRRVQSEPALSSSELATIEAEDHGHECVKSVTKMVGDRAIPVEGEVRHGIPEELILDYADEIGAATIVVGEHGDHSEHLGGVARALEENSNREVVVVELEEGPA